MAVLRAGSPYYLVDGTTRVAQSYADLIDGTLENAISKNGFGSTFGGAAAWTNVVANGSAQGNHCTNWSSTSGNGGVGQALDTGTAWTTSGTAACTENRILYCFQQ